MEPARWGLSPSFKVLGQDLACVNGAQRPLYICRTIEGRVFDVINIIFDSAAFVHVFSGQDPGFL